MALCTPTGSLEVFIRESILLPNGNEEIATNSIKIEGVNQLVRRIDTISSKWEDTGVEIVSIVDRPAIQADFLYFNEEKFVEPNAGETEDEFIGRCMSKLDTEFPDEEQRLAVCYSYWKPTNLYWKEIEEKFETYNDYPEGAKNNACRAVEFAEKNGWGDCGTDVGKQRAHQLCKGENISEDTISRMASFARHEQHKDVPYTEGCGGLMWDAWGGSAGINWAQSKLEELKMSCGDDCKKDYYTEEEQKEILMYAEDDNNGYYIGKDDLYIDMTLNKFAGIGDVITAIRLSLIHI